MHPKSHMTCMHNEYRIMYETPITSRSPFLRFRHRRTGSQGTDARTGSTGHRLSFSWAPGAGGTVDTSFGSTAGARGLGGVFVSATVDIVPPSSLLPTPSMHLARKYLLDCRFDSCILILTLKSYCLNLCCSDPVRSCVTNANVSRDRGCLHLERCSCNWYRSLQSMYF